MAATELSPTLKPTIAKPTLTTTDDFKGMSKARLRVNGAAVGSKDGVEKAIIKALERPMTTGQIAAALQRRSPTTLRRDYLEPMVKRGLLEQDGDYYKRPGVTEVAVARERYDDLVKRKSFAQHASLEGLVKHGRTLKHGKGDMQWVSKAWRMCVGRMVPTFKCRPEHWTKETTLQFLEAYSDYTGVDRYPQQVRQLLRYWHEYVLKQPITDEQKTSWGLDGKKDNAGVYNNIKLSAQQIKALADYYLAKGDLEAAAFVEFSIETFGRSEAIFKAAIGTMQLVQRKREYVTVAGSSKKNFDPTAVEQFRIIAALHPQLASVHVQEDEIYDGTLREFKTKHAPWPKKIIDKHAVAIFKEYEATRRGKATYFGQDGENFGDFNSRMSALMRSAYRDLAILTKPEAEPHTTEWYFQHRPTYVFRHIGAHVWLARLGGSYEALSEMGWEDPGIPKKFYAGYNAHLLDERIARIE
ncbi:MAG: hypothetical protein QXJ74_05290 [Nitrososphaera sp.]